MQIDVINTIATTVIAFVTVIGTLVGIYYNFYASGVTFLNIGIIQILFIISLWQFIAWVKRVINVQKK